MNKLFTKIASLSIGLALAIGVGVAVESKNEAKPAEAADSTTTISTASSSTTINTDSYFTVSFTQSTGANAPNANGSRVRMYATKNSSNGNEVTVTAKTGANKYITGISIGGSNVSGKGNLAFTFTSGTTSTSSTRGTYPHTASWASSSKLTSVTAHATGGTSASQGDITSITVSYVSKTTQYTVGGTITNGALSSTASVDSGSALAITLNPNEHYHLPTSLTSVTMGGNTLVAGSGYTYNNSTGAIGIASVTGNVVINATCPADSKYTVTYSAGTNGSGTYALANQWAGSYALLDYASISGDGKVNAESGYCFKDYTVGGQTKAPGDTITLSAATTVTVNFEERPNQAKYKITAVNTAGLDSSFDNVVPTGAGFSFAATYTSNAYQMTAGNTQTWTFTGYTGKIIKSLKASVKNNASSGVGAASMTNNGSSVTLKKSSFSGLGGSYAEYELINSDLEVAGNVVLTLSCSTNSFFCEYVILEWEDANVLDEDLTIDDTSATKSFTVGDTFAFGGSATATYSQTGDEDVTDDVTFSLGSTDIEIGDTITATMLDDETVTSEVIEVAVWYEDASGNTAAGSYSVTVSYSAVTNVSISTSTSEMAKSSEFTFGATVLPSTANSKVTWSASSEDLEEDTDFSIDSSTGKLEVDASTGGTIRVTVTTVGKDSSSASKTAFIDVTVTGDPVVTLNHSELAGFSGKTGSLTATAANFSGAVTYSWSSNNACVTVPNNNVATNTLTYVSAGTATITVTATYGQSESASASCTVTVTATSVTSVQWTNASNMTVYSGSTALNAAKITSWAPTYSVNNEDPDAAVPTASYDVKLNGTSYTLGTALDAGTYTVTLSYGGQTTASSNPILTVVQRLNTITAESTYLWEANGTTDDFTSTSTTLNGVTWTNTVPDYTNKAAGTVSKRYIQIGKGNSPEDFTIRTSAFSGTITKVTVDCASGDNKHTIAISVGGTTYLTATQTPKWSSSNDGGEKSGTGSSSGEIVITFDHVDNTKAMYIHSIKVESSGNIANSEAHIEAQTKVVAFAQYMNTQMNGNKVCTGDMSNLGTAWGNVADKYDELFGSGEYALTGTELDWAKDLLKNASANWDSSHDSDEHYCLERAMKTYEWCVSHYSGTCTAFMSAVRPLTAIVSNPILLASKNTSAVIIIVVISSISVAAIGGYFLFRKKKED